ncbi:2-hydroxyacid dehydrogenase [Cesiribacter andamanensis]|uniref:Glyoxylate/hydroxypyruvate reductase A n=1 Tax=Cesiribacter andamanensis AMV16 TaxID=1279009 RepID=M7NRZ1_9BACT|nr:glyoxylate/hydroxypyruvate reductase A [Cesiribacter andamanensis]EMR04465.1 Glyoxylate/hydroxypyruvate reductase A [Cesiribacter andamanensis AMV16]
MSLVIIAPSKKNTRFWQQSLSESLAQLGLRVNVEIWPEVEKPEEVLMAVTWKHPGESLYAYPHLRVVSSMGAGVDHILKDEHLPLHWQVVRIVDQELTTSMSNYLLAAVLNYHKQMYRYLQLQQHQQWGYTETPEIPLKPGILGLGELGQDIARKLQALGFDVAGYSRSPKELEGIHTYAGEGELDAFLQRVNLLICLLPLTRQTRGFLNRALFARCQPGTYLINVARGEHLVEEDLLEALQQGQLAGATLDVFRQEPLPADHPFWKQPDIVITPHIASVTKPEAAIPQVAENYRRMIRNEPLLNKIDRLAGY